MDEAKNYYHPLTELFTREYGWMPIDRIYEKYKNKRPVHICEFDFLNNKMIYTNNYDVIDSKVRSCTYRFGNYVGSPVQFNVHPYCEVLVSIDGGKSMEFLTASQVHELQLMEKSVRFYNLESVYDLTKNQSPVRYFTEQYKENYTYNSGIVYGIIANLGCVLTRYRGKVTILGTFVYEEE